MKLTSFLPDTHGHFGACRRITPASEGDRCGCQGRGYLISLFITVGLFCIEAFVSYLTKSLSLMGDGVHVAGETAALLIGFYSYRNASVEKWGTRANGGLLVIAAFIIFAESMSRINEPRQIYGAGVIIATSLGLVANCVQLSIIYCTDPGRRRRMRGGIAVNIASETVQGILVLASGIMIVRNQDNSSYDGYFSAVIALMMFAYGMWLVIEGREKPVPATTTGADPHP